MFTLSFADGTQCNLHLYTNSKKCETLYIYKKRKKSILFTEVIHIYIYKPKYWELYWSMKMEFQVFEKANNSIATKLCANLINSH